MSNNDSLLHEANFVYTLYNGNLMDNTLTMTKLFLLFGYD
jgi:hypothetical protein